MTNKEAAEMIRNDMKLHHDYLSGQYRKALNMAIDALLKEQDAVAPLFNVYCPSCGKRVAWVEAVNEQESR